MYLLQLQLKHVHLNHKRQHHYPTILHGRKYYEKNSLRKKCRMKLQSVIDSNKQLIDNYSIETTLRVCEKYCSPTFYMLVKSQIDNMHRKRQGYRYSNDIKQLALNIYFVSPKLYRMMQKSLSLPVSRTLRRITSRKSILVLMIFFLIFFHLKFITLKVIGLIVSCVLRKWH